MKRKLIYRTIVLVMLIVNVSNAHVRLLVRNTNWYYIRHRCYISLPSGISVDTGMGRGATELRVGGGDVAFAHEDAAGIWPPIAYNCPMRLHGGPEVALDLTFEWIYVADGLCWTPACKTFAQSFVAEGPELVCVRCFVASPPKPIDVTLHEGGPRGRQISSTKGFNTGTSNWGLVYWEPGEAPTTLGKTYTIVMRSADDTGWNPFVHSKGNCYEKGLAYFDDAPQPQTDLCLLISNPGDGYIRHMPIPNNANHPDQWSDVPNGQRFVARGRNLVFALIDVECGGRLINNSEYVPVFLVIRRTGPNGAQVGKKMSIRHLPGSQRSVKQRGVPYGPDWIVLEPGQTYFAGLEFADGQTPEDWKTRIRLYGELAADSHPTIASVWTARIFPNSIEVVWRKGNSSSTVIEYGEPGGPVLGIVKESGKEGWAVIPNLKSDTIYQFRLIATSPQGYKYHSPWYLTRTRALDGTPGTVEPMQNFGMFDPYFLPVADAPLSKPTTPPARSTGKAVELTNPGFESGIKGWRLSDGLDSSTSHENNVLKPYQGENMFGWMRLAKGKKNHELYRKDYVIQKVSVKEGNWYELSAWAFTDEPDWPKEKWMTETWTYPFFQSRCRNRISLVVDPQSGEDFSASNSTQWFSTHGKWMLLKKTFQAKSDNVTVGAAFYQRGERDWDAAFVDDFELVEIDKNLPEFSDNTPIS
ncbi:MAG: fibronectin type III domain-containing protein [Planctomycetota bacterium]